MVQLGRPAGLPEVLLGPREVLLVPQAGLPAVPLDQQVVLRDLAC